MFIERFNYPYFGYRITRPNIKNKIVIEIKSVYIKCDFT